jgi:hypothetical protein
MNVGSAGSLSMVSLKQGGMVVKRVVKAAFWNAHLHVLLWCNGTWVNVLQLLW